MGFDNRGIGNVWSGTDEMNQIRSKPSPATVREFVEKEIATADGKIAIDRAASDFIALYGPRGYIDNDANGKQINNALILLGKSRPTAADFEDVFMRLVANGMLELDQSKLDAIQKEEEAIRVAQYLDNQFNEETAYNMPMEELERKARGW